MTPDEALQTVIDLAIESEDAELEEALTSIREELADLRSHLEHTT